MPLSNGKRSSFVLHVLILIFEKQKILDKIRYEKFFIIVSVYMP